MLPSGKNVQVGRKPGNLKVTAANHKGEQLADILRKSARAQQTDKPKVLLCAAGGGGPFRCFALAGGRGLPAIGKRGTPYSPARLKDVAARARGRAPALCAGNRGCADAAFFFSPPAKEPDVLYVDSAGAAPAGLRGRRAFFEKAEAQPDFLFERIRHCQVDSVLWYMPDRCARETALLLKDSGVRVIGVADGGLPAWPCRFEISRENATAKIMRDWKVPGGCKNR